MVEMLCGEGIDVTGTEERDYNLNSVLMAMNNGHNDIVELLLWKGAARIDLTSNVEDTPRAQFLPRPSTCH